MLKQSHDVKVEVWELRNQIMEIQAELSREEEEYNYLAGGQEPQLEEEKEEEADSRTMRTMGEGCASDYSGTEG